MIIKKIPCVFIGYHNEKQVKWWNSIGRHLVQIHTTDELVDNETNRTIGIILGITGLFSDFVINKINSFHNEDLI